MRVVMNICGYDCGVEKESSSGYVRLIICIGGI